MNIFHMYCLFSKPFTDGHWVPHMNFFEHSQKVGYLTSSQKIYALTQKVDWEVGVTQMLFTELNVFEYDCAHSFWDPFFCQYRILIYNLPDPCYLCSLGRKFCSDVVTSMFMNTFTLVCEQWFSRHLLLTLFFVCELGQIMCLKMPPTIGTKFCGSGNTRTIDVQLEDINIFWFDSEDEYYIDYIIT